MPCSSGGSNASASAASCRPGATASRRAAPDLGAARAAAGGGPQGAPRLLSWAALLALPVQTAQEAAWICHSVLVPDVDAHGKFVPQGSVGSGRGRAGTKRPAARSDPGGGENGRARVANASSAPCAAWLPAVASAIAASASACARPADPKQSDLKSVTAKALQRACGRCTAWPPAATAAASASSHGSAPHRAVAG